MHLTRQEEKMCQGEYGEAIRKSMEIIVALGDIYQAGGLVNITSAQVSGVSYKTIGDAGLEYLEEIASCRAKTRVPSTLNPAGIDLENWEKLGFSAEFSQHQQRIVEAYGKMDVMTTCTCTPYLIGNVPLKGSHIAWSESSAVAYANSILGARTNREGGPSALAAAICGKTADYGYHLSQNRLTDLIVEVKCDLKGIDYDSLGYLIGKNVKEGRPYFKLKNRPIIDNLKGLGAALASSGAVALYHIEGITPEYQDAAPEEAEDKIIIDQVELDSVKKELSTTTDTPDLICLGCPHASLEEIRYVAEILENKTLKNDLWLCTSINMKHAAARMGYAQIIEEAGGKLVFDTCMVVAPIEELDYKVIGVNSAKAANYVPNLCGLEVVYDDLPALLDLN